MANNTLLTSDNWASGSLAVGWSALTGLLKCSVVGGSPYVTEPNALSTEAGQAFTGSIFATDHISEIKLNTWTNEAGTQANLLVRIQSGTYSGYKAIISNSTLEFGKVTSGVFSQIGSTITGLTITTNDTWSLAACGSTFAIYRNNVVVGFFYDATYTGGSPGFSQYSSVNITHTQINAWRGYTIVQTIGTGVWERQGCVIPPNTADLSGFGAQACCILYDSNPQILSGNNVYKMWFWAGATGDNVGYAESLDGINWTRNGSDVVTTGKAATPQVIKVGSTYHLYTCPSGGGVYHCTSSNGITWSAQTQVLSVGTWDAVIYFFAPFYVDTNGTWHALYSGSTSQDGPFNTGYATSSDGVTWTKYASNPVVNNWNGVTSPILINGVWYAWGSSVNPGRGSAHAGVDPSGIFRRQTTNFTTWTNLVSSLRGTQLTDDVNGINGGVYGGASLFNISGKTYIYFTTGSTDAIDGPNQISMAIGPVPITSIVTQNENAISSVSQDNFSYGSGSLNGNWTKPTGTTALQIVSGPYVEATATSAICAAVNTGSVFTSSQYSQVTIQTLTGSSFASIVALIVRASTTSETWYEAQITSNEVILYVRVNGSVTQLQSALPITFVSGDIWRLEVSNGNDGFPVLSLFQNEFLILQTQDFSNTLSSGNPGMLIYTTVGISDVQISSWYGGNTNVIPSYPSYTAIASYDRQIQQLQSIQQISL